MKEIEIQGIDEKIYFAKSLYNMPVYIWENDRFNGFYLSLCVKYGSLHTSFLYQNKKYNVPNGIAHYLEHLKFNEKKNFSAHEFYNKLGSDINAFTTFEYTNYEVSAHDNYKENLEHLVKYVLTPYFTKTLINKERGIISEEIKMDKDNPYSKLFYKSLANIFKVSHYKDLVSGEINDIKKIGLSDINLIYQAFYHPENMFLVACGNVKRYDTMQIINDTLSKLSIKKYFKPKLIIEKEPFKVVRKEEIYQDYITCPKAKVSLKIPISKFKGLDKLKIMIYSKIILGCNFGNTSDFKEFLIENQMINSFGYSRMILDNYLIVTFTYESDVYKSVKDLIISHLKNMEINFAYLERYLKCFKANYILEYENKEMVSSNIQDDIIFYDKIIDDEYTLLDNIKLDTLNKFVKIFNTSNISTTIVIPKEQTR